MDEKLRNRLVSWIEDTMKESGFSRMIIDLDINEKGEGFAADVFFAQVTDEADENKKVHLVIKMGKDSESFRKTVPMMREAYKRELFIYDKVFPTFREFEAEKNIVNVFDSYPKCYKTFLTDDMEVLVLENLKKRGFSLHDRTKPMNLQHIHLVLKNYAKLHALSFALRDQNLDKFTELTANYDSHMRMFMLSIGEKTDGKIHEVLREAEREDLVAKYEEEIKRSREIIVSEILDEVIPDSVIMHGDCHNNNFLFQYKDNDGENPLSVSIIDWQVSSLHSPALDLSCFLYFSSSGESLSRLDELLKFYHTHLKNFLRELGSDVDKLFPYSALVKHWRKNSPFAFFLSTTLLHFMYIEQDTIPSFDNVKEPKDLVGLMKNVKLRDQDVYSERLISIIDHHLNFILT